MRVTCLLIFAVALLAKVNTADDIYWEGEDETSKEFLEVDTGQPNVEGHFARFKRGAFDLFNFLGPITTPATTTAIYEEDTAEKLQLNEDVANEADKYVDDSDAESGSGLDGRVDLEAKEKTLRVTFVVMQPYQKEYSNRDSKEFREFSQSLAQAVDQVFASTPGTHKANLVRIQSRPSNEFSCKVTLEIVTTNSFEDTNQIANILEEHIKKKRILGGVVVDDNDFSAVVIDPGLTPMEDCASDEIKCNEGRCLPISARCNGTNECFDGVDEEGCPIEFDTNFNGQSRDRYDERNDESEEKTSTDSEPISTTATYVDTTISSSDDDCYETLRCEGSSFSVCLERKCDGVIDCPNAYDESDCSNYEQTTPMPTEVYCKPLEFRCDVTRCLRGTTRCDGNQDCDDGSDEDGCETCGANDFRCDNGKCIEPNRRCDRVVDCPTSEDERNCECRDDEFQCVGDGSCIEKRKLCDGVNNCRDGSDELDCDKSGLQNTSWSADYVCGDRGKFRCGDGTCISVLLRCDGYNDCAKDGNDELNCMCAANQWQCDRGECIDRSLRCDGRFDCPTDKSDERNCVVEGYYRCGLGKLIPIHQRCNRHYDCDDGDYSDEQNCPCGDGDFKCDNGYCIPPSKRCDRTHDCQDGSDEQNCKYGTVCMAYQYKCTSGQCVPSESWCNGTAECTDFSDERNCPCKRDEFKCHDGSCINIAKRCNGQKDCNPNGEDEYNCGEPTCPVGEFTCYKGSSVLCGKRCDQVYECDNGEDEDGCDDCNFECDGKCLEDTQICNNVPDCEDGSDEWRCDICLGPDDFRCKNGECIKVTQRCNGVYECSDNSDEHDCNQSITPQPHRCDNSSQYECRDGQCIDENFVCDKHQDCNDNSDEENCSCDLGFWQCLSGKCIPTDEYCDGFPNCEDKSDEANCYTYPTYTTTTRYSWPGVPFTTAAPITTTEYPVTRGQAPADVGLNIKTYPAEQTVRYGGDVVFSCRDEGTIRAPVRWVREGGRPMKPGFTDINGRLEMTHVTTSDSGVYICQAPRYLGSKGAQVKVVLHVEKTGPTARPDIAACPANYSTCINGQCVLRTALCNGRVDCTDGSDEEGCHVNGVCEPIEFKCANRKCVLKTWLCDGQDDCDDGSDEDNCAVSDSRSQCMPFEFACTTENQCIPKSFHCDGQSDCLDKSDEIGCTPVHITRPPSPSNIRLNPGDTLTLTCEAVGVPIPLISWRLNWGHVPQKCKAISGNGVGHLICPDMQFDDSGAYSCEAINNKATTFAAPDSMVYVNRTAQTCPSGYFNSEAVNENECIRCFCFGKSTQCRSADLYTYNMPTPLGEGGTRLVGIKQSPNGEFTFNTEQPIAKEYFYQPLRNGATVTQLMDPNKQPTGYAGRPYLSLPETYNGNQLKSYGGHIKYRLQPHKSTSKISYEDYPQTLADIIIFGKYQNLTYVNRFERTRSLRIEARLTPGYWQKAGPRGPVLASREDIMMALDEVIMILLRADFDYAGVNITEFNMESAEYLNVGLGAASLVEECTCPEGYEGLSCQKCVEGYERVESGAWLGACVAKPPCPPMTYGNPRMGEECKPCPCPLTNRNNQFARTCSLQSTGQIVCDCMTGYEGSDCSYCAANYIGNPMIPGDTCRPRSSTSCNPIGTKSIERGDYCVCKDSVEGRHCDQCKNGSFHLSDDYRQGCALCFCSGVSQECRASNWRRVSTYVNFNMPQVADQVKVYKSAPLTSSGPLLYAAPIETTLKPILNLRGEMEVHYDYRTKPAIWYWSLPINFAGDKVTAYGGYLRYELRGVPITGPSNKNYAADVQLISNNSLTFHYISDFVPDGEGYLNVSVQLLEKGWQRSDGKEVSREHFLLALADVATILIKGTYTNRTEMATLLTASIETAAPNGGGSRADHVEQCLCPLGYMGTSCEDCAPGYTRKDSGLYLEHCGPCDCNGHSNKCHPETGVCYDCVDNTAGPQCELCRPGYNKDSYGNCVTGHLTTEIPTCNCDPRGTLLPCYGGQCQCKQHVEGEYCERCRYGTFGMDAKNPLGCHECYCSGVTKDCAEASHYNRVQLPAPIFGENYGGYSLTNMRGDKFINDQFLPAANKSELMYMFNTPPDEDLYWSLPVFSGDRVLSYGGVLSLTQEFSVGGYVEQSKPGIDVILIGNEASIYWSNPTGLSSASATSYQVPLQEENWYLLNTFQLANRFDFMAVLKDLRRVLVRATLSQNALSTAIADVSMDTAAETYDVTMPIAKGVEICVCPSGYTGTSCETCLPGYYKDTEGYCTECDCNGHDCELNSYDDVMCLCRPPFGGLNCSIIEPTKKVTTDPPSPPPDSTVVVTITSPTIKIQEIGSTVEFMCLARSTMTENRLQINWYKDDGNLPYDRVQIDNGAGILRIHNLQISDSGRYVCETNDGVSSGQATVTLKVPGNEISQPVVTIIPRYIEAIEGDRLEMTCSATGNPTPKISWQRTGIVALPKSAKIYGPRIVVEKAMLLDGGEYRCVAQNTAGTSIGIGLITIRPKPDLPTKWQLSVMNATPQIREGESVRLTCTGSPKMPPDSLQWVRQDGGEINPNVQIANGVLSIMKATLADRGVYVCQTNAYDALPATAILRILPDVMKTKESSNVTLSTDFVVLPVGSSSTVDCYPIGYPVPSVRWTKLNYDQNKMPIVYARPSDSFGASTSQRDNTLVISNVQESDRGYYRCDGISNGVAVAAAYVYLEVERREPPKVSIHPQGENYVTLGTTFEFHCIVTGGIPEPIVTWNRNNGRELSAHVDFQKDHRLSFHNIVVNDEGLYTCSASNDAGTASATAALKVQSTPEIVVTPNTFIEAELGDRVAVVCRAEGYPEPQVSIISSIDESTIVPEAPRIAQLIIPSVSEDGDYTCLASSRAGDVKEQFVIRVNSRGDVGVDMVEGSGDAADSFTEPRALVAIEGQDSKLRCDASYQYRVDWRRADNRPLQSNAQQNGRELVITATSLRDAGLYECTLTNRRTDKLEHSAITRLHVISLPRITLRPPTQTVHPGDSPIVECVVEGDDIKSITWRPIDRYPSRRMEIRNSTLQFRQIEVEDAGQYECIASSSIANATAIAEVKVSGPRDDSSTYVRINKPQRAFRVGETVNVLCRARSKGISVKWERSGTNQFVESRTYGDGTLLTIPNVQESDAGIYKCVGEDVYLRTAYDEFNLEVVPGVTEAYNDRDSTRSAKLGDTVLLPCYHSLEEPVRMEWRKEFSPLPTGIRRDEPNLHLERITEADAGIYICKITNSRGTMETRTTLRVNGLIPRFDRNGWTALPTLRDAYMQFDIEVSFKPIDGNGIILFNSQNPNGTGDYLVLQLQDGVPEFSLKSDAAEPLRVLGDRPLQLNAWHTIRLSRNGSKVTMDVDNTGPFVETMNSYAVLDLKAPLYIGGAPPQRAYELQRSSGFVGCVSMLILGKEEKNIMADSISKNNVKECDSCNHSQCLNDGVCQEARNERGFMCLCVNGFAGLNCDRTGEACRPGLCGPGRCTDTLDGYKCSCPVTFTGRNCDVKQNIAYPAFTGSAYLAIKPPKTARYLRLSMKIKPKAPVTDGIIMYCAQSARGYGGFTALTVRNGRIEFRYDVGDGSAPIILASNKTLIPNEWTDVQIARVGLAVSLIIGKTSSYEGTLSSPKYLNLETPMFVGGVDDTIVLNNNTGVSGGFNGCIKEVKLPDNQVDLINSAIQSSNVQECASDDRGDIPETDGICSHCGSNGYCAYADSSACTCINGYTGTYCDKLPAPIYIRNDPCLAKPCRNMGLCKSDYGEQMNYTCDCLLGFAGSNCQMNLRLQYDVGFNGNGYLELPSNLLLYDFEQNNDYAMMALDFHTYNDGVLLYQHESNFEQDGGDYVMLRVDNGIVVLEWDFGSGKNVLTSDTLVNDGERHIVIAKLKANNQVDLEVDRKSKSAETNGLSKVMNADSNIFIGGIPNVLNHKNYPGLVGCIDQIEFKDERKVDLGAVALSGLNPQRCKDQLTN